MCIMCLLCLSYLVLLPDSRSCKVGTYLPTKEDKMNGKKASRRLMSRIEGCRSGAVSNSSSFN